MNNNTPFTNKYLEGHSAAPTLRGVECAGFIMEHTKKLVEMEVRLDEQERVGTKNTELVASLVAELSKIKNWIIGAVVAMVASQMGIIEFIKVFLKVGE